MTVSSPKRVFPHPPRGTRVGFGEPPYKRAKTHHALNSGSPAQPCGDKTTAAPIAFLPTCDQSPRPLTSCASNFNQVRDPQAPANFQSVLSLPFDHRVPQGLDCASLFGNPTAPSRTDPAPAKDYIPQHEALVSSSSNAPPSPAPPHLGPPMVFSFGPQAVSPSFNRQCALHNDEPAPVSPEWANTDLSLFWDPFDSMSFNHLLSSGGFLPLVDPLSHNPGDIAQQHNPPSPFSRSMSRSSFASSSYPDDYPTPGSDTTAVTTPAPSEGCLGSPSEHLQVLFGQDFLLSVEGKKGDHELSYVSGSAPLSTTYTLDFSLPQAPTLPPTSNTAPLSTVRRHSEPANLATCNFPSFFVPCREVSPQVMSAPCDSMTHSIADTSGSASGSHAVPSSIAPHQTQLPPLQHPRPVRPFKPQILLSGLHYDPKDFIRRRSEPILPLPELDVASHVPLDVVPEADEDGDSMEVEDPGLFEEFSEEGCAEQSFDVFGDSSSWIGSESQDLPLFNEWSWPQSESTGTQPAQQVGFVKALSQVPVTFGAVGWNTY